MAANLSPSLVAHDDQPIIARCTPQGPGALALLRITGQGAVEIACAMSNLACKKKLTAVPSHTIHYGSIGTGETLIDRCLFFLMRAPKTFTGQDTVEISCHNNPFICAAIVERALQHGARLAQEGEFSRRAVLNNKMDLLQAESIHELIQAQTTAALKKTLAQLDGSLSQWVGTIQQHLVKALAFTEASFEFIDEEMTFDDQISALLHAVTNQIQEKLDYYGQQHHVRQGMRIALIGSVNAGKSSLFNALIKQQRAIVTPIAGTTRDSIEVGLYKNSSYWTFIDTAGLRETDDRIEQEGIERSHKEAAKADIILLVQDCTRAMSNNEQETYGHIRAQFGHKIISVHTKVDATTAPSTIWPDAIVVSSVTGHNIQVLEIEIEKRAALLLQNADAPFLLNQRQNNLLVQLHDKLAHITTLLQPPLQYEIISYHLNEALANLSEMTGKSISEQGMDAVFRQFCVGK